MKRFIEGESRTQVTLLPACLDDYILEENPVRVVDVFVDELDLEALGFEGVDPAATGRPAYHPAVLLKIYIYGYLNRIQSSRRLERRAAPEVADAKTERLKDKIEKLKQQMAKLKDIEAQLQASPDQQISLTDPDARSMATSGRGSGTVGYNVQTAVDDKHHLIIAHE